MNEEFIELSDLTWEELVEVVVPRQDLSAEAHRRCLALEILLLRARPERKPLRAWEGAYAGGEEDIVKPKKKSRRRRKP